MALLRFAFTLIAAFFKALSIIVALAAGASFMLWLFIDDLPLGSAALPLSSLSHGPYIDLQAEIAGTGAGGSGCFISQQFAGNYLFHFYLDGMNLHEKEVLEQGDRIIIQRLSERLRQSKYVKKAVALALDGIIDKNGELDREKTQLFVPNEFVAEEVAKYENLLFGASINPYRRDTVKRLVAAKRAGAVLVRIAPSLMQVDLADKNLASFYLALLELNLPLLIDSAETVTLYSSEDLSDPKRLELPLSLGVTIIAGGLAAKGSSNGEKNFDRILPLFSKYRTLYGDISGLTQITLLGKLKKASVMDSLVGRLVYGSNWPFQLRILTSPWYHLGSVRLATLRMINRIDNDWDRDLILKAALGITEDVFIRSSTLVEHYRQPDLPTQGLEAPTSPSAEDPLS